MKIFKYSLIFWVFLFACASTQKAGVAYQTEKPIYSVKQLLAQLPADNAFEEDMILYNLCSRGEADVLIALKELESENYDNAKFAMHGLTNYFAQTSEAHKSVIQNAFLAALREKFSIANKALIIGELQKIADQKAIPVLTPFLMDVNLCDPAARALITIGGPSAANSLLSALDKTPNENRASLIQALGELKYKPAVPQITLLAEKKLKETAVRALATIADISSEQLIKTTAKDGTVYQEMYLDFAKNLAAAGNKRGAAICREILSGTEFPNSKLGAIAILASVEKEQAADDVMSFYNSSEAHDRVGLLRVVEKLENDAINQRFQTLLMSSTPQQTCEIIGMFQRQKKTGLASSFLRFLSSESAKVRSRTISALSGLWGNDFTDKALYHIDFPLESSAGSNSNEHKTDRNKIEFAKLADDTQVGLLQQLVNMRSPKALPVYRKLAVSGNNNIQLLALRGLGFVGESFDLDLILNAILNGSAQQKKEAQQALANVVLHAKDRRAMNKQLFEKFDDMGIEEKKVFLPSLRLVGDNTSLSIVKKAIEQPGIVEPGVKTLAAWPNTNALDGIVELAETTKNADSKASLIRGAVRIMNQNEMGDIRSFEYCKRLIVVADNAGQKSMIISQLGNINSPQSVRYLSSLLSDPDLDVNAAQALAKLANESGKAKVNPQQLVAAVVEGTANETLAEKLSSSPLVENDLNKPPRGFVALFNGENLDGWKGLVADPPTRAKMTPEDLSEAQNKADEEMRKHWKIVDGVLYFDGKGHSLCTTKDYTNFEMLVDWKIEKFGDSGIYLRGAPQVQIWDTAQWPEGSGALYNNQKNPRNPLAVADKPIGEWNTFRIKMIGERVTVYLNDVLVVDNVIMENYWERDKPIYPTGQIELQSHSSPLYFRNIFIRELPVEEEKFVGSLFNGEDLSGWIGSNGEPVGWQAENGILYTNGEHGGYIFTEKQYSDFELEFEFRLPENGNSGVGIRTPLKGDPAYIGMEIQVLDDYGDKYTQLKPWQYTGSIYGVQPPSKRATKKANEWQTMKIVAKGPKVDVYVNGEHTVDANLIEHLDQEATHPGLKNRKGFIGFQNHSTKIEYRNIRIKEL